VSAFWIPPENVRKVTPTGDPLAAGVVWHVGQKTFLPPAPLVMGFGCVFLLGDEAGVEAHRGDRVTKSALRSDGGDSGVKIDVAEEEDEEGDEEIPEEPEAPTKKEPAVGNAQLDAFLDGGVDFGGRVDTKKEDEDAEEEKEKEDEEEDKEEPNDDDEDAANGDLNKSTAGKVRISAKERRLMKKQRKKGDDGGSDDDVHDPIKQTPAEKPAEAQPQQQQQRQTQQPANTNKPLPRGKSSKAKKAAKKYADQDDEDRELAIALARASGKRGKKGGKGKGGGKGGDSSSEEDVPAKTKQTDSRDRAESNRDKPARQHGAGAGKEGGHARRRGGQDVDDDEPVLEDPAVFAARDVERMSRVDWFTGAPTESDAIDFAVCVVAPYQALQSFRYKVKLTPGTQKKGKAGKQALDILCKAPASVMGNSVGGGRDQSREEKEREGAFDARCKEMMRSAEGAAGDLAQLMCGGGVKVSMPAGAAKAMNAGRKGKR
jgi:hypothetical protein